jgi:hypothetical protein
LCANNRPVGLLSPSHFATFRVEQFSAATDCMSPTNTADSMSKAVQEGLGALVATRKAALVAQAKERFYQRLAGRIQGSTSLGDAAHPLAARERRQVIGKFVRSEGLILAEQLKRIEGGSCPPAMPVSGRREGLRNGGIGRTSPRAAPEGSQRVLASAEGMGDALSGRSSRVGTRDESGTNHHAFRAQPRSGGGCRLTRGAVECGSSKGSNWGCGNGLPALAGFKGSGLDAAEGGVAAEGSAAEGSAGAAKAKGALLPWLAPHIAAGHAAQEEQLVSPPMTPPVAIASPAIGTKEASKRAIMLQRSHSEETTGSSEIVLSPTEEISLTHSGGAATRSKLNHALQLASALHIDREPASEHEHRRLSLTRQRSAPRMQAEQQQKHGAMLFKSNIL